MQDQPSKPEPGKSPSNLLTVGEALKKGTLFLEAKGCESSRLSAELLLAHVLSTNRLNVYLRFEESLEETKVTALRSLLVRRGQGEPVAYLLGKKEFMGLDFEVNASVLIPRPDSELLVESISKQIGLEGQALVLDMGCGSGNLLLSILHLCPAAKGIAVDYSPEALEVTERNAFHHRLVERITRIQSDLYLEVPSSYQNSLDYIISNPPYICDDEWSSLAVEIQKYEPRQALQAGPDGLLVYRPLIAEAPKWLKPGGKIALEISARTQQGVLELLNQANFQNIEVHPDLGKQPRLILAENS